MFDFRAVSSPFQGAHPRAGVVVSSNFQKATAKVLLQPEGLVTGWLPVATQWAGNGWGVFAPPSPGDQVLIVCHEGNYGNGIIVGAMYSNAAVPPTVQAGELIIAHKSGCSILLSNAGRIAITGDLYVSGAVYDAHGSLDRLRGTYNAHTHNTANGGSTSPPRNQDPA